MDDRQPTCTTKNLHLLSDKDLRACIKILLNTPAKQQTPISQLVPRQFVPYQNIDHPPQLIFQYITYQ